MKKKIIISAISLITVCSIAAGAAVYAMNTESNSLKNDTKDSLKEASPIESVQINEERTLKKAVSSKTASKDDIYYMMLNSIDYFDKVSGTVYYPSPDDKSVINVVDFQSDLSDTSVYSNYKQICSEEEFSEKNVIKNVNNSNKIIWDQDIYGSKDKSVIAEHIKKTYTESCYDMVSLDEVSDIPDKERITKAEDGQPCYNYRINPTNLPEASICLFPQEMAFGFLTDRSMWDISDIINVNGNLCYHIKGHTNKEYGKKLNVATFEFYVDVNTGVLLKYIGYDNDGLISDYMYTENIKFDKNASKIKVFDKAFINGYTSENAIESN